MIAIYMYRAKYQKWTLIPLLFGFYILALIGLIVLDMTTKFIAGYFLLILACNYFNFLGFYKILTNLPGKPGEIAWSRTKWYFRTMNVLYALTLGLAFVPRFGPTCTATKVYPPCMNWACCLFIINFIFHCVMSCRKDYFLGSGSIMEGVDDEYVREVAADDGADEKAEAVNLSDSQLSHKDWEQKEDLLSKKLFRKQMNVYLFFQGILAFCNVAIQLWGRVFVHNSHFLGCTEGGHQWLYTTVKGEVFVATHMVLIITQGVMLEYALYKVPKKMGWFKTKSVEEADDDFTTPTEPINEEKANEIN
eukprot:CAMPEP_0170466066 /NCGR_PEP_ID=MMETSP0123-20130129/10175_1 /TAXON_ID=182087 /ORGANISM="Favella ehrenbergii, Strain Fehren 1" /LENGTH=305 /DNA_ID=CAMNT_0010732121 /DNA_START=194 /DNA_END=1111 /DNA_ORIENTATION=+